MNQLKNILVGYDFRSGADTALTQAARLAAWNDARLVVLHVTDEQAIGDLALALNQPAEVVAAQAREANLRELEGRLRGLEARVREVVGSPLHELLSAVDSERADLLVLGLRGEAARQPGASVLATKLIRKAGAKVLLVHPNHPGPYRHIVVGVDFSDTSAEAVQQALRMASRDGGEVHVLHVFEPPWHNLRYRFPALEFGSQFQERFESMLLHRLRAYVGELGGDPARCAVRGAEHHSLGIIEFAGRLDADLVVLGTRRRSRMEYVLLGSTAEFLLRHLDCSVLTTRARNTPGMPGPDETAAWAMEEKPVVA